MRLLGLITARGGSKRIPEKNIKIIGGKPLVAWTVEEACKSEFLDDIVISTDDKIIAEIAHKYGAKVPFIRPAELAGDNSPHIDCVFHAIEKLNELGFSPYDAVVLLQPTSPLRTVEDIDGLLKKAVFLQVEAMVSICESIEHPYFSRFINQKGMLKPIMHQNIFYPRKQNLQPTYFINGAIYFNTIASLRKNKTFYPEKLYGYEMPIERSLQIDNKYEFNIANFLLRQRIN